MSLTSSCNTSTFYKSKTSDGPSRKGGILTHYGGRGEVLQEEGRKTKHTFVFI